MIDIQQIYLMLGNECNLQCKYCIQHDIVRDITPHGINEDVIDYIHKVRKSQSSGLRLNFYGGEPLIFWNDIKQYAEKLKKVQLNIITNGKLLTQDKVDFINDHKISIGLSYDGKHSIDTRGYNVLEDKFDLVLQIEHLCLTGVVTKFNYPKDWFDSIEEFNKQYIIKHKYKVSTNLDLLLNNNDLHGLSEFDLNELRHQIQDIADHFMKVQKEETHLILSDFYVEKLLDMMIIPYRNNFSKCRNGINIMNIDANGNLYICHNTHTKIGTIKDDYCDVLKRAFEIDKTSEKIQCNECQVNKLCRGGCMLTNKQTMEEYFCNLAKSFYEPIVELKKCFYF